MFGIKMSFETAAYVFEGLRTDWRMRQKEDCTVTRTFTIEKGQKPTEEQIQEVMEAKKETQGR